MIGLECMLTHTNPNLQTVQLLDLPQTSLHTVAVIHALKKFGIELLLTMAEAIAAGLGSNGCKVPKVTVRLVHARKLHQNFLIFVSLILIYALIHHPHQCHPLSYL